MNIYGHRHRMTRADLEPLVVTGLVACCLCGDPIEPGQEWHLDHRPGTNEYRGAAHACCNSSDGAKRGNAKRPRARRTPEQHPGLA